MSAANSPVGVPDPAEVEALAEVMTDADRASSEYPFSDESRARAVLTSDWLADRDRTRDRELGERIAAAIEADRHRSIYGDFGDGWQRGIDHAAAIARAESERAQHTGTGGE